MPKSFVAVAALCSDRTEAVSANSKFKVSFGGVFCLQRMHRLHQ